jgi:isoamylase
MNDKRHEFYSGFPTMVPYGANVDADGVHFSIFSRHATHAWLLLFESVHDDSPSHEIELHPEQNRTGDIWHIWVRDLKPGQLYLWRMDGPRKPERGHRFDPQVLLLDPYAKAVTGDFKWSESNPAPVRYSSGVGAREMPKCIVCSDRFEWEGDRPLNRPWSETVIYECHVRGLTAHETSNVEHPGSFAGIVEKIPYFKSLGVTALELLPVQEFSAVHHDRKNPLTGEPLVHYWGYNTVCFFAPNGRYSASGTNGQQVQEFKWMVRELHRAGIEVILDVVFNHTAEGDDNGPTFCFRGIDNSIYYLLDPKDGTYLDYTGCGNTVNCNHPVVREFVISCLHYWVLHMHVDGFRFDLASVLGRDETGKLLANPPLLRKIEEDPILRWTKIIAEAWDAAGAYQVGAFTGRWAEWNGKFRDDVRRFWRGDSGSLGPLATRLAGSSDLYGREGRTPHHSINFACSHDGFTLNDWTSYQHKHNLANGHNNENGDNNNLSINHGVEGPTQNLGIETLRERQMKNVFATLMLSLGVPMVLGGDEFRRTQQGNNNPYCQDNEISWFDWTFIERYAGMLRFAREMISFRQRNPSLRRQSFYSGKIDKGSCMPDIIWYGAEGQQPPDWKGDDLALAALIRGNEAEHDRDQDHDIFLMFNANIEPRTFAIPIAANGGPWKIALNTQNSEPDDIYPPGSEPPLGGKQSFSLKERSIAVMIARRGECS